MMTEVVSAYSGSALRQGAHMDTNQLSQHDHEQMIGYAIWAFEVEGITVTREEAEAALEKALSKPVPEI